MARRAYNFLLQRLDFFITKKFKKTRRRHLTNRRRTTTGAAAPKIFVNPTGGGVIGFSGIRPWSLRALSGIPRAREGGANRG